MKTTALWQTIAAVLAVGLPQLAQAQGHEMQGRQPLRPASPFQACAACHSLEPGRRRADLKKADRDSIVKAIRHCRDTYFVTTADGQLDKIWEFNLRFKTDTSDSGPAPGAPVLLGVGHGGDRAAVVFSSPAELGKFISQRCE